MLDAALIYNLFVGLPPSSIRPRMLGQRAMRRLSTWRAGASTLEEVSFLPILNIMKGLPVVHTVAPSASTFRAVVDMVKYRTGSLMVMKDDQMAGIITERDILDKLSLDVVGESRAKAVEALMTPADSLSTCVNEDDVNSYAPSLAHHGVRESG